MKINWKVRFRNRLWLWSFLSAVIAMLFGFLSLCGIALPLNQNTVLGILYQVLSILSLLGVLIDPTTQGLNDSQRAMSYQEPFQDEPETGGNG